MTMIAYAEHHGAPILTGDLLISGTQKPDQFVLPALSDDIMDYLNDQADWHPSELSQKIYILKNNVCAAFSGNVAAIKLFLEDLTIFCRACEEVNAENLAQFLQPYASIGLSSQLSSIILVAERQGEIVQIARGFLGNWLSGRSELVGDVLASGSGAPDFLQAVTRPGDVLKSHFAVGSSDRAIQTSVILISQLLAQERALLSTVKKHWGAGFEVVYLANGQFFKLDDITYIIHHGAFDRSGTIDVPIPAIILHYKYHSDTLVITAIAPSRGSTEIIESEIIIRYTEFRVKQFIVSPLYPALPAIDLEQLKADTSFTSERNGMGYILETGDGGKYIPASFHVGPELKVVYQHLQTVTITMKRDLNDILMDEAKKKFPFLPSEPGLLS